MKAPTDPDLERRELICEALVFARSDRGTPAADVLAIQALRYAISVWIGRTPASGLDPLETMLAEISELERRRRL